MCSALCGCFLYFLNFVLSRYVVQVLSEWFLNGSILPYYYWYHFCFQIPHGLISIVRSLYFKTFSASFLMTFLSPVIATSINMHVPFLLSQIMMSDLLLGTVLSVRTCWPHNMVTLFLWLVSTDGHTWSYQCLLSNFTPIIIIMCLVTGLFFLVILLNQQWPPPLRLQASHCSTFRIMCDVPSIAVFCSESIECFPGTASKFFLKNWPGVVKALCY